MRLMVSGSESFIGTALKAQCRAQGIEVIGIDTRPSSDPGHVQLDIRAPELHDALPRGAEALVHLAAISRDADCRQDPRSAFDVNVGGTLNLMQVAHATGAKQFLFASSEWVYGDVRQDAVQTEDAVIDAGRLTSEYALTKIVGERLLAIASLRDGPPVTVLRFGIVYGPRPSAAWSAVESLFEAVRTRDTVEIGSRRTARRFIHVTDIAHGILAAVGRSGYEIFNISGERLITLQDIIEESAQLLTRRPHVIERRPDAFNIRNPDNRKAREILGWTPRISLREGLSTLRAVPAEVGHGA